MKGWPILLVVIIGLWPVTAAAAPVSVTTVADHAMLEWFQKPGAVQTEHSAKQTIVSWISADGQIKIRSQIGQTQQWSAAVTVDDLRANYGVEAQDDHNAPSLLELPNGQLLIFYSVHDVADSFFVRQTILPGDISHWSARRRITANGVDGYYCYPQAKLLSNGHIVLFARQGNWYRSKEVVFRSHDQGVNWSLPSTIVDLGPSNGTYAVVTQRGDNLGLAWSQRSGQDHPTNIYFAQSLNGGQNWQTVTGRALVTPLGSSWGTRVYQSNEPAYIWDVAIDKPGHATIAFVAGDGGHTRYLVAKNLFSYWQNTTVASANLFYPEPHYYAGGIVIDPRDTRRVVVSRGTAALELEAWVRSGVSWHREKNITTTNLADNVRPQFIAGSKSGGLIWASGQYQGLQGKQWTGFQGMSIQTTLTDQP